MTQVITDRRDIDFVLYEQFNVEELTQHEKFAEFNKKTKVRVKLERLLKQLDQGVHQLSDIVAHTYFSHSLAQRISGPQWLEGIP